MAPLAKTACGLALLAPGFMLGVAVGVVVRTVLLFKRITIFRATMLKEFEEFF